jgi:hypothetical protein
MAAGLCGIGSIVHAQAWVPGKGEGTVSLTYQNYDVAGHYDALGRKNNNGGSQSQSLVTEIDYGITDSFAVTVMLPFVASKYTGPPVYLVGGMETFPGPLDDGSYHGAFQDVRVDIRRLFWAGPIPVAPFIGASIPTHDYETVGEAVPGRHRRDLQVGANVGVNLDRLLRGAYAQVRYGYATEQRIRAFGFTRSNVNLEVGSALSSRVSVRTLAAWQVRHEGPTVQELAVDWRNHDRFMAPTYTTLGVGASVAVGNADVYALWLGTVSGNTGAHRARTLAAGITFGFGAGLGDLGGSSPPASAASNPSRGRFRDR